MKQHNFAPPPPGDPAEHIARIIEEGTPIDEAVTKSWLAACDFHRRMGIKMAVWDGERVVLVDAPDHSASEDQ